MTNPSGNKGTKGETARVKYLVARGWKYATRIPKTGNRDKGDLILDQAVPVVIESKETKGFTPSSFLAELEAEIANANGEFGFVIAKKRGTTDVGQYYALTSVERMMWLVEQVYSKPDPEPRRKLLRRVRSTP